MDRFTRNFDPVDRVLTLPAGESGQFEVTYQSTVTQLDLTENSILNKFRLYQNYPNPFNPTTKVKFTIPLNVKREMLNVTLKVYDILGNEVATLVNEEKPSGTYEVYFDASSLASGIYFYTLRAGNYIETKKMILLK